MIEKMKAQLVIAAIAAVILIVPVVPVTAASDTMTVTAIDLGGGNSGEATMVRAGNGDSLLIDSGDTGTRRIFTWLDNNGYKNRKFDTLVTHWHDDHAGNTAEIIEKYRVGTVYIPDNSYLYEHDDDYHKVRQGICRDVKKAAKKRGTKIVYLKKGRKIKVGKNVIGKVLYVNGSPAKENWYAVQRFNNQSAAIMFTGGGTRFFAAGDVQEQAEKRILKSGADIKADIFKLSHHGNDRSNSQAFIKEIDPTYSWFTYYGASPSNYCPSDVKDSVRRMGKISNTFGTRYNGTLRFTCSNGKIKVSAERNTVAMYRRLIGKKSGSKKTVKFTLNKKCMPKTTDKMTGNGAYYDQQVTSSGKIFTGKWMKKNGRKYLVNSSGMYATDTVAVKGGKYYAFNKNGTRYEKGWKTVNGKKYYFGPRRYTGFRKINGKKYYFMDKRCSKYKKSNEGVLTTGFKMIGKYRYYMIDKKYAGYKPSLKGVVATGWSVIDGKTYYMSQKGVIQTGLKKIGKDTYYFAPSGIMLKGAQTIGGKKYYFDANGRMAENPADSESGQKDTSGEG